MRKIKVNFKTVGYSFVALFLVAAGITISQQLKNTNAQMYGAELEQASYYDLPEQFEKWREKSQSAYDEVLSSCSESFCVPIVNSYNPEMEAAHSKGIEAIDTQDFDQARQAAVEFSNLYNSYWNEYSQAYEASLRSAAPEEETGVDDNSVGITESGTYECTDADPFVCGSNGITYENFCLAISDGVSSWDDGECKTNDNGNDTNGSTQSESTDFSEVECIQIYEPVCGIDEETYGNECMAKQAGVTVEYKGECKDFNSAEDTYECTDEDEPVCSDDGVTYKNWCEAEADLVFYYDDGACNTSEAGFSETGEEIIEDEENLNEWLEQKEEEIGKLYEACETQGCNATTKSVLEELKGLYDEIQNFNASGEIETAKILIESFNNGVEDFWNLFNSDETDYFNEDYIDEGDITLEAKLALEEHEGNLTEQSLEIQGQRADGRNTGELNERHQDSKTCVDKLRVNLDNPGEFWEVYEQCHEFNQEFWEAVSRSYENEEAFSTTGRTYSEQEEVKFWMIDAEGWVENLNLWREDLDDSRLKQEMNERVQEMQKALNKAKEAYKKGEYNQVKNNLKEVENLAKETEESLNDFHENREREFSKRSVDQREKEAKKYLDRIKSAVRRGDMSEEKAEICENLVNLGAKAIADMEAASADDNWEVLEKAQAEFEAIEENISVLCPTIFVDSTDVEGYNDVYIDKKNQTKAKNVINQVNNKNKTLDKVKKYSNIVNKILETAEGDELDAQIAKALEEAASVPEQIREKLLSLKEAMLREVKELKELSEELRKAKKVAQSELNDLNKLQEEIARHSFIGKAGEELKEEINDLIETAGEADADRIKTEIKKLKAKASQAIAADTAEKYEKNAIPFLDADTKHWFYEWSKIAKDRNFIKGDGRSGGKYLKPSSKANIAEFIVMIDRITSDNGARYTHEIIDRLPSWAQEAASRLSVNLDKLFDGQEGGDSVNRVQVAQLLMEAFDLEPGAEPSFPDTDNLSEQEKRAISAVNNANIMTGEGNGNFNPYGELNRAALVKVLVKADQYKNAKEELVGEKIGTESFRGSADEIGEKIGTESF